MAKLRTPENPPDPEAASTYYTPSQIRKVTDASRRVWRAYRDVGDSDGLCEQTLADIELLDSNCLDTLRRFGVPPHYVWHHWDEDHAAQFGLRIATIMGKHVANGRPPKRDYNP